MARLHLLRDVHVHALSLVRKGANRRRFFLRKADEEAEASELVRLPSPERLIKADDWSAVYCVVASPEAEEDPGMGAADPTIPDLWADEDEIRKAAHRFMQNGALVNAMHENLDRYGQIVENAVALGDFEVDGEPITKGTWYVAIVPNAEGRAAIERGEWTGVSLEGSGLRELVEKSWSEHLHPRNPLGRFVDVRDLQGEAPATETGATVRVPEVLTEASPPELLAAEPYDLALEDIRHELGPLHPFSQKIADAYRNRAEYGRGPRPTSGRIFDVRNGLRRMIRDLGLDRHRAERRGRETRDVMRTLYAKAFDPLEHPRDPLGRFRVLVGGQTEQGAPSLSLEGAAKKVAEARQAGHTDVEVLRETRSGHVRAANEREVQAIADHAAKLVGGSEMSEGDTVVVSRYGKSYNAKVEQLTPKRAKVSWTYANGQQRSTWVDRRELKPPKSQGEGEGESWEVRDREGNVIGTVRLKNRLQSPMAAAREAGIDPKRIGRISLKKWEERLHPRDDSGKFSSVPGGGGVPDMAEATAGILQGLSLQEIIARRGSDSKAAPGTLENPIDCGDDVDLAAKHLAAGKHVRLAQPRQVSTLLDKLKVEVDKAQAAGTKAPSIDLCKVSVPGTNLFCAESKGIQRIQMPQLGGEPPPGSKAAKLKPNKRGQVDVTSRFIDALKQSGVKVTDGTERADHLRATQEQLNGQKVGALKDILDQGRKFDPDPSYVVSRDGYILDGHHRWAAKVAYDLEDNRPGDIKVGIRRVDMGIDELLDLARKFADEWGLPQRGIAKRGLPSSVGEVETSWASDEDAAEALEEAVELLAKAETFSKPGTADVTAADAAKLEPLARHYLAMAHPFTSCVRDQVKHGLEEEHAKRRCAVLLDKFDPTRARHSTQKAAAFDPAEHPRGAGGLFVVAHGAKDEHKRKAREGVKALLPGKVEGSVQAAVRDYQRRNDLLVDGLVGSQTAASLLGHKAQGPGEMTAAQLEALRQAAEKKKKVRKASDAEDDTLGGMKRLVHRMAEAVGISKQEIDELAEADEGERGIYEQLVEAGPERAEEVYHSALAKASDEDALEIGRTYRDYLIEELEIEDEMVLPTALVKSPRTFSTDVRERYAGEGVALPDGSYPIPDRGALARAVQAYGRAPEGKRAQVRAHIIKRARALDALDVLPDDWNVTKSSEASDDDGDTVADMGLTPEELERIEKLETAVEELPGKVAEQITKAQAEAEAKRSEEEGEDGEKQPTPAELAERVEELQKSTTEQLEKLGESITALGAGTSEQGEPSDAQRAQSRQERINKAYEEHKLDPNLAGILD